MLLTDLCRADKTTRLRRRAQTLLTTIQRRKEYHERKTQSYSPAHAQAADDAVSRLSAYLQTLSRLDRDTLKSHTPSEALLMRPVRETLAGIFQGLPEPGPAQHTDWEASICEHMAQVGRDTRAKQHKSYLNYELAYRHHQGWFAIFNTLTVDDGNYYAVFSNNSKAFKNYLQNIDREAARAAYGSVRKARNKLYHTYVAVVEAGAKHGRLHIHVLHLLRQLPAGAVDPNYGRRRPDRREIDYLKTFWRYGYSSPKMVRTSPDDAYGKAGYRWPWDKKRKNALRISSPQAVANYIAKYISKSYGSEKRSKYLWRVRKTHNLGKPLIEELLSTLTPLQLLATATNPALNLRLNHSRIPAPLLRLTALQLYQKGHSTKSQLPTLAEMAVNIEPRPSPLQCSRGLTRASSTNNQRSSGHTLTMIIKGEAVYKSTLAALISAAEGINKKYFHNRVTTYGTTTTQDQWYQQA